jgi:hypothetical protein
VRRRRADVDADSPEAQSLGRDVAAKVIRIVVVMTMLSAVVRIRRGQ